MKTINLTKKQIKDVGEELSMSAKCFYHFPTGEIKVFYPNDAGNFGDSYGEDDESDSEYEDIFANDDYFEFESMESRESFQMMEDFIETVSDARLVNQLVRALNQRKPFRHFRDTVDNSTYRQKWFDFRDQSLTAWVEKQIHRYNQYASIRKT